MQHKIAAVWLAVWILLLTPMTAFAHSFDVDRVGSVSLSLMGTDGRTPIAGAGLSLYYVASLTSNSENNLCYTFTEAFAACGAALDDPALAVKMDVFVGEGVAPVTSVVTDPEGRAVFANLPLGLYLVKQTAAAPGGELCTSFLVTVPNREADEYVFDVNASPKTEVAKLTSVTVKKVWNTDDSTPIADSVSVRLLRDGVAVKTATLNRENNWQVTFRDMPASDAYSIQEVNIPQGFTATYVQSGDVFTVVNSASLIQTGQLIWPIPVLALSGLLLIAVGVTLLRKTEDDNA